MKLRTRMAAGAALGVCLGAAFAASATAQTGYMQNAYVKGEIGGGFADQYTDAPDAGLDRNFRWGLGVGTSVAPHLRLEAEYIHDHAHFSAGGGHTHANLGMANAYYDIGDAYGFTPFVGAGVGGGSFHVPGFNDSGFAYQLTAGASKALTPRLTGELAYKFLDAPNLRFGGTDTGYQSSFITAGLRFRFGG